MAKRSENDKTTSTRIDIIEAVKTPLGFFVLVVLVVEVILGITSSFSQGADRTYLIIGMLALIFSLIIIVTCIALFRPEALSGKRPSEKSLDMNSRNHAEPGLVDKVRELKDRLLDGKFSPDMIIGISRGGLVVAAHLSEELGKKPAIPVISLWPHPKFDNPLNGITFRREHFKSKSNTVKIIIVDDICRSGRTLADAKAYVENSIDMSKFKIETAALYYYDQNYSQPIGPAFYVDRPKNEIRDFHGDIEPSSQ